MPAAFISGEYIVNWTTSRVRPAMEIHCGKEEIKNVPSKIMVKLYQEGSICTKEFLRLEEKRFP